MGRSAKASPPGRRHAPRVPYASPPCTLISEWADQRTDGANSQNGCCRAVRTTLRLCPRGLQNRASRSSSDSPLKESGFEPPVRTCARRLKPPPNLAWLMPSTSEATFTVAIAYYPDRDSRDLSGIPIWAGSGRAAGLMQCSSFLTDIRKSAELPASRTHVEQR